MLTIGELAFLSPYALFALAAVPIIWWLLRFTPPRPDTVRFPPIRFLLGLVSREETPHKSPWWLTLLRTVLAALLILAAANPVLNPFEDVTRSGGPLVVIVDDGWAAAHDWSRRAEILRRIADENSGSGREIAFVPTAPRADDVPLEFLGVSDFAERMETVRPQPFAAARLDVLPELEALLADRPAPEIVWLTDGVDYGDAAAFAAALGNLAGDASDVAVYGPATLDGLDLLEAPTSAEGTIEVPVTRVDASGSATRTVRALALNGRTLANTPFTFEDGAVRATTRFELPVALRNQVARIEVVDSRNAAGVYLLDDRWRRKSIGLVAGVTQEIAQPLLSPLYYLERALEPSADIHRAVPSDATSEIRGLLDQGLSVLVLADIGHILEDDLAAIEEWLSQGGILIRFAGPRLAGGSDQLVPVALRHGDRALGGALSWTQPQTLSPFESDSPFFGLEVTDEVTVNRQVLAEPSAELSGRTWARLADGTPLVTAAPSGNGLIVLFHVPANPEWSNLPISGLFVQMLERIVDLSQGVAAGATRPQTSATLTLTAFTPTRALNGFGELTDPPPAAVPIAAAEIADTVPGPTHPPGIYRRGSHTFALNVADAGFDGLAPLGDLPGGVELRPYQSGTQEPLRGVLLLGALVLLLVDGLCVLVLAGRFSRPVVTTGAAGLVLALAILFPAGPARAQDATEGMTTQEEFALRASLDTRLAYVLTGNSTVDQISLAGLTGLSNVLLERTALEPAGPIGIDIDRDEIVFFPIIYWPVLPEAEALTSATATKIDTYLKNGGTIFFDTRDHQISIPSLDPAELSDTQQALRRIVGGLDIPPLEIVPADHVLTKAFYLLQDFPGRWDGGPLWVEASLVNAESAERRGSSNFDGVSSIIIGSNDYAGAWAIDLEGRPLYPVVPGGTRQREMAYRTGVNIVMYSLTGNYKADQVHVPALLERLGQ